ncbi:NUDIX domain-containing protein [Fulvivirga sp. 29W222]|uniref:NUDIX domain-containing protein n=1 Tax=Fulvivirga marina TaxID=2494733 RepID=A0A937G1J9_9BACT|nr:NUDIX domain-containing protein [Fulvivirga marina]MBL6448373.1 NUDIX domain-containing protein [Fulvivirga marina]
MSTESAGILMYRIRNSGPEVFLVHPGGPFFKKKDNGSWSIPKGLPEKGENLDCAALREFEEETGLKPDGNLLSLGAIKQKGGKVVHCWAMEGNIHEDFKLTSNTFEIEWPPRSGRKQRFPEIDKARFFPIEQAIIKINPAQVTLIERLLDIMD